VGGQVELPRQGATSGYRSNQQPAAQHTPRQHPACSEHPLLPPVPWLLAVPLQGSDWVPERPLKEVKRHAGGESHHEELWQPLGGPVSDKVVWPPQQPGGAQAASSGQQQATEW
jgi:hypothetical protein